MGCQISRKNDSDHPIDLVITTDTMTTQYHDAEINYKARLEKKLCLVGLFSIRENHTRPPVITVSIIFPFRQKKHRSRNSIFPNANWKRCRRECLSCAEYCERRNYCWMEINCERWTVAVYWEICRCCRYSIWDGTIYENYRKTLLFYRTFE